jgi:hypothetical protein
MQYAEMKVKKAKNLKKKWMKIKIMNDEADNTKDKKIVIK